MIFTIFVSFKIHPHVKLLYQNYLGEASLISDSSLLSTSYKKKCKRVSPNNETVVNYVGVKLFRNLSEEISSEHSALTFPWRKKIRLSKTVTRIRGFVKNLSRIACLFYS